MITLITGSPGAGKTVMAISMMKSLIKEGRPLFVHGVPNLAIPHQLVVCNSPACAVCPVGDERKDVLKADEWHIWAPEGAILLFDEVQNIYRPRAGKVIPPSIMAFETHRHKGLDFFLVSQSPRLFDANIQAFISRHLHFKQNWARRIKYEWPEVKMNVQSTTDSISSTYKLDKSVFKLFKSSSMHTKIDRKIPPMLFLIPVLLGLFIFGVFYVKNSVASRITKQEPVNPSVISSDSSLAVEKLPDLYAGNSYVEGLEFPILSAVMISQDGSCFAFSQQGTIIEDVSLSDCYKFQQNKTFNPYRRYLLEQNRAVDTLRVGATVSTPNNDG